MQIFQKSVLIPLVIILRAHFYVENRLTTPEELRERVSALSDRINTLKGNLRGKSNRMKELDEFLRMVQFYIEGKPVADKLATIKWKGKREQFSSKNENALRLYHLAERKLCRWQTIPTPHKAWLVT